MHADIPSIVENNVSGILVPESDPESLAAGLMKLVDSTAARRSMGEAGSRLVVEKHQKRVVGAGVEAIYRQVVRLRSSEGQ